MSHSRGTAARRKIPSGTIPGVVLAVYVAAALFAPIISPQNPVVGRLASRLAAPLTSSGTHFYILGTDALGRDVLSRMIYGTRVALVVAVSAVVIAGVAGVVLGVVAGWSRRWVGVVIMRIADMTLSVPFLLLAILVVAVLGPNLINVVVVLALTRWPRYARVAYASALETRERGFVRAAVALGAGGPWIMRHHLLPEILPLAVVIGSLELGLMVLFEASLSFLGLGVQPPTPSWGSMLSDGQQYIATAWWLTTFPGLALFGLVLCANLVGDAVRDRLDPRLATVALRNAARRKGLRGFIRSLRRENVATDGQL